jgi:hypothetical protein
MRTEKYTVLLIFSFAIFACIALAQAQKAKTIQLPNGDEVVDISGEWDDHIENYGIWSGLGNYSNIYKIELQGNSFVGIRMKNDKHHSAGTTQIQGELDKDGIKKVQVFWHQRPQDAKVQISADGNKIIIDDGERTRLTLIRK